jgi:hypothetical protein
MSRRETGEDKVERREMSSFTCHVRPLEANFLYKHNVVSFRRRRIR